METANRRRQPPRKVGAGRPPKYKEPKQPADYGISYYTPNLRSLRLDREMTQKQLALESDTSVAAISYLEWNDRPARLTTIRKLAKALDTVPGELIGKPLEEEEEVETAT